MYSTRPTDPGIPFGRTDSPSRQAENMHDVFSDWHRRAILYCIEDCEEPPSIATVTRLVDAWERGIEDPPEGRLVPEHRRQWLLHAHVLMMDDLGVLSYDPDAEVVSLPEDVSVSVSPPWKTSTH